MVEEKLEIIQAFPGLEALDRDLRKVGVDRVQVSKKRKSAQRRKSWDVPCKPVPPAEAQGRAADSQVETVGLVPWRQRESWGWDQMWDRYIQLKTRKPPGPSRRIPSAHWLCRAAGGPPCELSQVNRQALSGRKDNTFLFSERWGGKSGHDLVKRDLQEAENT